MLYYLLFGTFFTSLMYSIDVHNIIKDKVVTQYNRYNTLLSLIGTKKISNRKKCVVICKGFVFIYRVIYASFLQYMNTNMKRMGYNTYELTYVIKGRVYKMIVTPPRGPPAVLQIINDEGDDVTDLILPYMGPYNDWYGTNIKPSYFGFETLTFELSNSEQYVIKNKE